MGGWRGILLYLAFLAVLGYLFPAAMGLSFLDPHILLAYGCSAPFFVSSVAVEALGSEFRGAPPKAALAGRTIAITGFGWASSMLALALGLVTVNLRGQHPVTVLPDIRFLAGVAGLGLSLALFTVACAAVLTLYLPFLSAKVYLRRAFVIALLGVILLARYGEVEWKDSLTGMLSPDSILRLASIGMAIFLGLAVLLLFVTSRHARYSGPVSSS
jgi:hypothetical protein